MKNAIRTAAAFTLIALGAATANAQVQSAEAGFAPDIAAAQSTLTRAQVTSDFVNARQNGQLQLAGGNAYQPANSLRATTSAVDRSAVRAQAVAAVKSHQLLDGESSVQ